MPQASVWFTNERYDKLRSLTKENKLSSGLGILFAVSDGIDRDLIERIKKNSGGRELCDFFRDALEHELKNSVRTPPVQ
jgi:hypothetical protein